MLTANSSAGARWSCRAALVAALACGSPLAAAPTDPGKYHSYQELTAELETLVSAHSNLAKLVSIGRTREGRDVWAVEIANQAGTPAGQRPALLIAANLEGDHVIGSELALYVVEYLLNGYGSDATVKQRLDHHAVYVVPRVNPDGAELMFAPVKTGRRTNANPLDTDNDGRTDENGPDDVNKDGFVTLMRVRDPKGAFMVSPEDPRLMKRADPAKGESGGYALYWEGLDTDRDGYIAEDGPGGVDPNRNFMHQYPAYAPDAGRYMASEAETRALLDYVLAHRNIAAILTFGESDNLITAPTRRGELAAPNPINLFEFVERSTAEARKVGLYEDPSGFGGRGGGRGFVMFPEGASPGDVPGGRGGQQVQPAGRAMIPARRPATTINAGDIEYFRAISDKYRELTGIRSAGYTRTPAGAFFEYGYYQYGVPSFSTPGWGLPGPARPGAGGPPSAATGAPGAGGDAARIPGGAAAAMLGQRGRGGFAAPTTAEGPDATPEGIDLRLLQWMDSEKVDGFVAWSPFTHPTLGAVEIGGFKPYAATNPPASKIADLGAAHSKFVLYLTSLFGRLRIAKADASPLGAGLYRIKAEIENAGFLPAALAHAVTARAVTPVMVQLGVPPEAVITGSEKTVYLPTLAGSGGRQAYEWVVKVKPGTTVTLKVASQKSGSDAATVTLK